MSTWLVGALDRTPTDYAHGEAKMKEAKVKALHDMLPGGLF